MAPSVWYYNRSAPFWDFVASVEQQGLNHPIFAANGNNNNSNNNNENENENNNEDRGEGPSEATHPFAAFAGPWSGWGRFHHGRGFPHHGPPHPHGPPPPGPPPEHGPDGELPPPPPFNEKDGMPGSFEDPEKPEPNPGEPSHPRCGPHGHRGPHGAHGHHGPRGPWGRRGRCGGRGGFGRFGGFGGPPAFRGPFGLGALAELFQSQMTGEEGARGSGNETEDFEPEADVFDTETAFVIHVSLAGAKKEDLGVSWDADKSELTISGVVHRPGDEDFLKTLSMDERKIGAFLRKIRLGSRANPAQIDIDGITAKLDEGILTVTVPKEDKDWTEVKKVDVE